MARHRRAGCPLSRVAYDARYPERARAAAVRHGVCIVHAVVSDTSPGSHDRVRSLRRRRGLERRREGGDRPGLYPPSLPSINNTRACPLPPSPRSSTSGSSFPFSREEAAFKLSSIGSRMNKSRLTRDRCPDFYDFNDFYRN